jgi:predicted dehydrogenase
VSLGVAVVGLGVGQAHARAYASDPRCEVRWVYDLDSSRATSMCAELGAGRVAESLEEVLADGEVGAVSIASFDDAHFEQGLAVLRAGKHLFVEKPVCRTLREIELLKSAWTATPGLQLASNLVLRAAPLYRWLRDEHRRGGFGRIYAFDGDYLYGRLAKLTDGWRRDVNDYSVMLGGGVHLVDLLLWITGERPTHVSAVGNRISTEGTAFRYLDHVAAAFSFESGLVGRVTANFGSVHPHQHAIRIFGTEIAFLHDDLGPRVYRDRDPSVPPERLDLAALPALKGELIPPFVSAILGEGEPVADGQHEFDVISACVAADQAVAEGRLVEVEYR